MAICRLSFCGALLVLFACCTGCFERRLYVLQGPPELRQGSASNLALPYAPGTAVTLTWVAEQAGLQAVVAADGTLTFDAGALVAEAVKSDARQPQFYVVAAGSTQQAVDFPDERQQAEFRAWAVAHAGEFASIRAAAGADSRWRKELDVIAASLDG